MTVLSKDIQTDKLSSAFLPSSLFPFPETGRSNLAAWRNFWNAERLARLKRDIKEASLENGFEPDAFEPFWQLIDNKNIQAGEIPEKYLEMFGVTKGADGYTQLSLLKTGENYDAEDFFSRITSTGAGIFDVGLFNKRLGDFLKKIFLEIALLIGFGVILVIFLYFLDWMLSLAVLAPVAFALVSTLGTMKIIGHPLDIPSIMLWIIIMGMGIDYAIYYVCFYQRYRDETHPAMDTIKMAMFLSAFTTLIGFGVLAFAQHSLLRSIGLTSLLGIGYSIIGAYLILPMLMKKIYAPFEYPSGPLKIGSREHLRRAVLRFRHLPAYPRLFARFKIMIDPMFQDLHQSVQNPRNIIDIGCGYGIPAVWLLEIYPQAKIYGMEPNEDRGRIASQVIGNRGKIESGRAPDLPSVEDPVDTVLMLNMLHLISDDELKLALERIYQRLSADGTLIIRATVPSDKKMTWKHRIESIHLKLLKTPKCFRKEVEIVNYMKDAGFAVSVYASTQASVKEKWFVGKK